VIPRTRIKIRFLQVSGSTRRRRQRYILGVRRLAIVLALLALSGSPALAAGRLHVVVVGQNHHPKVGAKWHYSVHVSDAKTGKGVACKIHLQFLFGTSPVAQVGRHVVKNGVWSETFGVPGNPPFPAAARGIRVTLQAIATAKGYTKGTGGWWVVAR
jgi:hypothetical protein